MTRSCHAQRDERAALQGRPWGNLGCDCAWRGPQGLASFLSAQQYHHVVTIDRDQPRPCRATRPTHPTTRSTSPVTLTGSSSTLSSTMPTGTATAMARPAGQGLSSRTGTSTRAGRTLPPWPAALPSGNPTTWARSASSSDAGCRTVRPQRDDPQTAWT